MEDCCPGSNFTFGLDQVYYAIEGSEAGKPVYVRAQIKVVGGQTHTWLVSPKNFRISKLKGEFFDVAIEPKAEKTLEFLLRKALSEQLIQRPYDILLGPTPQPRQKSEGRQERK